MTRWINILLQTVLGLGHVVAILEPILTPKQKVLCVAGLAVGNLIVSNIASAYNPDGTHANEPYKH